MRVKLIPLAKLEEFAREEFRKRHGNGGSTPARRPMNLDAVLELGSIVYFPFRGRAYGVPPLPWRAGEQLLDACLEARSYTTTTALPRDQISAYFAVLRRMQDLIWRAVFPVGRVRRFLRRLRLLKNPFLKATEGELITIALFLLQRRMNVHDPALRPASR